MSLDFDDKILGEKVHYYCDSGSEHEVETASEEEEEDTGPKDPEVASQHQELSAQRNFGPQTGPKGVKADYEFYKRLEYEKNMIQHEEFIRKTLEKAMISRPLREDLKAAELEAQKKEEAASSDEDEFIKSYRQRRMEQMRDLYSGPTFGTYNTLSKDNFIEQIDNESPNTTIVIHISLSGNEFCKRIDDHFSKMCRCYSRVKFCNFNALTEGMSHHFVKDGVPSIIAYKNRTLIANLIRIDRLLDKKFCMGDLENLLIEKNILTGENSSAVDQDSKKVKGYDEDSGEESN